MTAGAHIRPRLSLAHVNAGVGLAMFFLMLFIPTSYPSVIGALLVTVVLLTGLRWWRQRDVRLHPRITWLVGVFGLAGVGFVALGLSRHAPGALRLTPVYVIWPAVYAVLVASACDERILKWIDRVLILAAAAISLYALDFILVSSGRLPTALFVDLGQDQRIGFYTGYMQFNLDSLASMLFLVPYLLATVAVFNRRRSLLPQVLLWTVLGLSLLVTVLSLRRALVLVVAFAPVLIVGLSVIVPTRQGQLYRRRMMVAGAGLVATTAVIAVVLTVTGHGNIQHFLAAIQAGYQFAGDDPGASARAAQLAALTDGWRAHPVFGAGLGAVARVIRSDSQPWAYELSYNALLFQTGLVGLTLYVGGVAWLFWNGVRILRSDVDLGPRLLPILVGSTCFLLANATNPYLAKFAYLWVIFLPLAYINVWLLDPARARPCPMWAKRPPPEHGHGIRDGGSGTSSPISR